jgi:hypothetical protein
MELIKSESIKEIAVALAVFHLKVGTIKKDAQNPFFKSSYASLSNILDSISVPLAESNLTFTQFPCGTNGLTTILIHTKSGEFIQSEYEMKPVKDDPQGRGSVITYQRRYALASILGLNIDDDDDGNTATHGGKTPEAAAEADLKWLNKWKDKAQTEITTEFQNCVKALKGGNYTIADVRKKYKVSKQVEAELTLAVNE